jgi:hypothetical protein
MSRTPHILCVAASLLLSSAAVANDLAVDPGQQAFERKNLPLVCMEVGTIGAAIQFDSLIIADRKTGVERRLSFKEPMYNMHTRLLAAHTSTESLALPIFHLEPGQYVVLRLEFVTGAYGARSRPLMTFGVGSDARPIWFEVKPGCVNYVGGIDVKADWANSGAAPLPGSLQGVTTHSFAARTSFNNRIARDAQWAGDRAPCMASLPWTLSLMRQN